MKEIYSFSVDVERDVEETVKKKRKNKDTGKMEEVSVDQTVRKEVPIKIILKEPNRREIEDADMEYSVQMSKCIKRGILTKAMLAKKYSDSGGLLTEADAKYLTRRYTELGELQNKYTRLGAKPKKTKADEKKAADLLGEIAGVRNQIVDIESTYSSLFNHTADSKAQNKAILWYLVNLSYYQVDEDDDDDITPFFKADTSEEKIEQYYDLDENGDDIFDIAKEKITTLLSFWYFSSNASLEDYDALSKDIDEGNLVEGRGDEEADDEEETDEEETDEEVEEEEADEEVEVAEEAKASKPKPKPKPKARPRAKKGG